MPCLWPCSSSSEGEGDGVVARKATVDVIEAYEAKRWPNVSNGSEQLTRIGVEELTTL
jgi:hypothetical protein